MVALLATLLHPSAKTRWRGCEQRFIIAFKLLLPLTQTNVVPQLQLPDGSFVQDSSDIIEAVERRFPRLPPVIPCAAAGGRADGRPRQRLACKLLELFGDEWLLTAAFHWRWAYSGAPGEPWQQLYAPPSATAAGDGGMSARGGKWAGAAEAGGGSIEGGGGSEGIE